jgi:hypothetical protein
MDYLALKEIDKEGEENVEITFGPGFCIEFGEELIIEMAKELINDSVIL